MPPTLRQIDEQRDHGRRNQIQPVQIISRLHEAVDDSPGRPVNVISDRLIKRPEAITEKLFQIARHSIYPFISRVLFKLQEQHGFWTFYFAQTDGSQPETVRASLQLPGYNCLALYTFPSPVVKGGLKPGLIRTITIQA